MAARRFGQRPLHRLLLSHWSHATLGCDHRVEPDRTCDRAAVQSRAVLVKEGEVAGSLWYLVPAELLLERAEHPVTRLSKSGFVCWIALLTGNTASATVIAEAGTYLLRWDKETLKSTVRRSQRPSLALEALIVQDMAQKLSKRRPLIGANTNVGQTPLAL